MFTRDLKEFAKECNEKYRVVSYGRIRTFRN